MAYLDQSSRDLYKFDGSQPSAWLAQMDQYFKLNHLQDDWTKPRVGTMYLDSERWQWALWHQRRNAPFASWAQFAKALIERFDRKSNLVDKHTQTDTQPSKAVIFTGKKETKEPKGLFLAGISVL